MVSIVPGPIYSLPSTIGYDKHDQRKIRSPQFSLGGRLKDRNANITPGPKENVQDLTRYGRTLSNAYSIAPRNFVKDPKKIGPGPGNYDLSINPYLSKLAPPSYSLGRPISFRFKSTIPGPNAYAVKDILIKKSSPAFVIGVKTELREKTGSPGPAFYPASNLKLNMAKAPEYSISGHTKDIGKSVVPASNAYDRTPYKPGKSSPSYSFGMRHSNRAPPMILPCDKLADGISKFAKYKDAEYSSNRYDVEKSKVADYVSKIQPPSKLASRVYKSRW